jgi:hypothetical protein
MDNEKVDNSWWSNPLGGSKTFIDKIVVSLNKRQIPQELLEKHNQAFTTIESLEKRIKLVNHPKFSRPEFLFFVKNKSLLTLEYGQYEGLSNSAELLIVALEVYDILDKVQRVELDFNGIKEQELYSYVYLLLNKNLNSTDFMIKLRDKAITILPLIHNQQSQKAIKGYLRNLEYLSQEKKLALRVKSLFKKYNFTDYGIFTDVAKLLIQVENKFLRDLSIFIELVKEHYDLFSKLGRVIDLPLNKYNPKSYALILQHIALSYKYEISYFQFSQLLDLLRQWQESYQVIREIRESHDNKQYKTPKNFVNNIPGLDIYEQYKPFCPELDLENFT